MSYPSWAEIINRLAAGEQLRDLLRERDDKMYRDEQERKRVEAFVDQLKPAQRWHDARLLPALREVQP